MPKLHLYPTTKQTTTTTTKTTQLPSYTSSKPKAHILFDIEMEKEKFCDIAISDPVIYNFIIKQLKETKRLKKILNLKETTTKKWVPETTTYPQNSKEKVQKEKKLWKPEEFLKKILNSKKAFRTIFSGKENSKEDKKQQGTSDEYPTKTEKTTTVTDDLYYPDTTTIPPPYETPLMDYIDENYYYYE